MAVDKEKNTQVLVTFPNETLEQVNEFWHINHYKNRNEAIRELIRLGLDSANNKKKDEAE